MLFCRGQDVCISASFSGLGSTRWQTMLNLKRFLARPNSSEAFSQRCLTRLVDFSPSVSVFDFFTRSIVVSNRYLDFSIFRLFAFRCTFRPVTVFDFSLFFAIAAILFDVSPLFLTLRPFVFRDVLFSIIQYNFSTFIFCFSRSLWPFL